MRFDLDPTGAAWKRLKERLERTDEWKLAHWLDNWLYGYGEGQPKCTTADKQNELTKKLRDIQHVLELHAYEKAV